MSYQSLPVKISIKGRDYIRRHELSRGGMGEIVLYEHKNNLIAIKSPILIGDIIDKFFENEASLMWMLNPEQEPEDNTLSYMPELTNYLLDKLPKGIKSGFPQLIDYKLGDPKNQVVRPFIAMTYEQGARNLESILRTMKREHSLLPFPYILNIIKKICEQTTRIHKLGYLHNDLNLRNSGFGEDVLLFDLGISSKIGEKLDPNIVGTIEYSSPELDKKSELTEKSDSYPIGIMAYELSTGVDPIRELQYKITLNDLRTLTNKEKTSMRSKKSELKRKKHVGNHKIIEPIEKERSKYVNDKTPKGWQDLIECLTEPKPENRLTPEETIYEIDRIAQKNKFKELKDDELKNFMITFMDTESPESLDELEENSKKNKGFTYKRTEELEEEILEDSSIYSKTSTSSTSTKNSAISESIFTSKN